MVQIKFLYIENNIRIERIESLSRVPFKHEKIQFEGHKWWREVKEVTHYPYTENNDIAAICFLTY